MYDDAQTRRLFQLFATLFDYPKPGFATAASESAARLALDEPEAAQLLREFATLAAATPLGQMEESYTGVFELNPALCPYIGYHLFGETYKRSVFLLALKEQYRAHDFDAGIELPDHLSVMLRFLSQCSDPAIVAETIEEALLPALEKMQSESAGAEGDSDEVVIAGGITAESYRRVLYALQLVLEGQRVRA